METEADVAANFERAVIEHRNLCISINKYLCGSGSGIDYVLPKSRPELQDVFFETSNASTQKPTTIFYDEEMSDLILSKRKDAR